MKGFVHIHGRILGTRLNIRYLKKHRKTFVFKVILNKKQALKYKPTDKKLTQLIIDACIALMPASLTGHDRSFLDPSPSA